MRAWGLEILCSVPEEYSNSLTTVMMPAGHDADRLRKLILEAYDMSLGTGLGRLAGKVFRIGHLGDFNDLTLAGTLAGVEMGLELAGAPLRTALDNAAMWAGLQDGSLDFVVTDHCPFTLAQKRGRRRTPEFRRLPDGDHANPPEAPWSETDPPFNQVPGGAPGIETRVPLVYHFGVNAGRLSLEQFVNLTSTAAARRYGLYPRKGTIAPGSDADLVLFDPNREVTISAAGLHQNCDYTPYEGFRVRGWARTVISHGQVIVRDEQFVAGPGRGNFLRRTVG